jgi:uncharacterized protein YaiI (UPF0178 family)
MGVKVMSHIMNRTEGRPGITVSLILGLILLTSAWTEAGKISNADTADTLREVATASSSPLSNSAIVAILSAGTPVSETTTTTYSDGSTQTADLLIIPNTTAGAVTTTKDINLADGETEKVVDVATISGSTTTHAVTTTLPDASVQTKDETDMTKGDKTTVKAKVSMAGGGTQTITGETVLRGSKSATVETITNAAGQVYHDRIVITHNGALSQSETNTTRGPGGSISTVKSVMSTVLDPSAVGQSTSQESLNIPAAGLAVQLPNIEAQVLAPSGATSDVQPTVLPVPLPEPGTLMFVGMVLGAAGLRRGWRRMRRPAGPATLVFAR